MLQGKNTAGTRGGPGRANAMTGATVGATEKTGGGRKGWVVKDGIVVEGDAL